MMGVSRIKYYKNISTPRHPTWFSYYKNITFPTQIFRVLLYLAGDHLAVVSAGVTRPSSLLWAHAPDLHPLASYARWLGTPVFAGCRVPLLGGGPSRCCLLNLCGDAWTR